MSLERRLHALVSGRVQGVAFRWNTVRAAERLGLTGWVRNLPDGRVEILAEGDSSHLAELLAWLRKGPPGSRVEQVDSHFQEATSEYRDFAQIR